MTIFHARDENTGEIIAVDLNNPSGTIFLTDADTGHLVPINLGGGSGSGEAAEAFNVKDYGAVGDGLTDDTAAIADAVTAAVAGSGVIFFPVGDYAVDNLNIPNGIHKVYGLGRLLDTDNTVNYDGLVTLGGPLCLSGGSMEIVSNLDWSVSMVLTHTGTMCGIAGTALVESSIHDISIQITVISGGQHFGIYLGCYEDPDTQAVTATHNVHITGNTIISPMFEDAGYSWCAIALLGNSGNYGEYFAGDPGNCVDPVPPVEGVEISGNVIEGGAYGISLNACSNCTVDGNTIRDVYNRGITCEPVNSHCSITGNTVTNFGESGITLAFGGEYTTIVGNELNSIDTVVTPYSPTAAIQVYCGGHHNTISSNSVHSAAKYGIYLGAGVHDNLIAGNNISNYQVAGLALENDWTTPLPSGAVFSKQNFMMTPDYPDKPEGRTGWAYTSTIHNSFIGNMIGRPVVAKDGTTAIYMSQINSYDGSTVLYTSHNVFMGNSIPNTDSIKALVVFEDEDGFCVENTFKDNMVDGYDPNLIDTTQSPWTHFQVFYNNGEISGAT